MATKKKPNLTWDLKVTERSDGDIDGQLLIPKGATEAVISHLADRSGLTVEQTSRLLAELAATASEQISKHPNRYFVIPGLGAMLVVHRRARVSRNLLGRTVKTPESKSVRFKLTQKLLNEAMRWD